MEIPTEHKSNLYKVVIVLLIVLSLHFAVKIFTDLRGPKSMGMWGGSETRVITLTGQGEVQAVPDLANVSFTISKDAKTVKEAQAMVAEIEAKALEVLNNNEVEEKDIKTTNASFNPKYETKYVPCNQWGCPGNNSVVVGFTATESITVKVRNADSVGAIMEGLGTTGVTDLSGPNFSVEDEDALKAEARKLAIEDAKEQAEALAKDLGVRLGKVVSFNEDGFYPMPMYSAKAEMDVMITGGARPAELPKGENTITSNVSITYEIK